MLERWRELAQQISEEMERASAPRPVATSIPAPDLPQRKADRPVERIESDITSTEASQRRPRPAAVPRVLRHQRWSPREALGSADAIRRAIVLNEILRPPVSLRRPDDR